MGEELQIKIVLDDSQSQAASRRHVDNSEKMVQATAKATAAFKKALNDQAVATQAVEDSKTTAVVAGDQKRAASGRAIARGQQVANDAAVTSYARVGEAGAGAFGKIALSSVAVEAGMRKIIDLALVFSDAMKKAADRYREITGNFVSQRDKLGELAGIMGKQADNKFTLENDQFNKQTGFNASEGLEFRLGFQNSGQQFKGSKMSEPEFTQFEQQAGELAVARQIDPNVVGDLAGTLVGTKDRRAMGDQASEHTLGKLNSGLAILGAGKGDNAVLGRQFNMLASASLNEDEMKGVFQDSDEVATIISTMAEKHDAQAAEMARAAIRGMRDFDGKAGALLKKAAINSKTKMIDALKQLAPIVEAEAREKGVKTDDVLKGYFEDQLTREAIGTGINKGVSDGIFANREKVAAENQGPAPALKIIGDANQGERIQNRKADAGLKLAENEIGAENSRIDLLRKQAKEELTRERIIGTTSSYLEDFLGSKLTFGSFSPDEAKIEERQNAILQRRAKAAGVDLGDMPDPWAIKTPESLNQYYNSSMDQIKRGGGMATMEAGPGKEGKDEAARKLDETNGHLKRIADAVTRPQAGGQATPLPPSIVQPGPPRAITR